MNDAARTVSTIAWFEIAVTDFDRAVKFYERVLGEPVQREKMGESDMGVFRHQGESSVGGALWRGDGCKPSAEGTVVYFQAQPDLAAALARVEPAGGRVVVPKTALPGDMGHFAQFLDSEGNRVGLYSTK